jgi:hypothetical protein
MVSANGKWLLFPAFGLVNENYMTDVNECFDVSRAPTSARGRMILSVEKAAECSALGDGWRLEYKGRLSAAR